MAAVIRITRAAIASGWNSDWLKKKLADSGNSSSSFLFVDD